MPKKKVLLIDDEKGFIEVTKMYLDRTGDYEVFAETDPKKALTTAREIKPDIIFLDVVMPGKDGGDVMHEFENDDLLKDTPIVFLSGVVREAEMISQKGMFGGRYFLSKPVGLKEIVHYIENYAKA